MKQARGIRNNNPGNIERNSTVWQGMRCEQKDKRFITFEAMKWGYRAMFRTLNTYQKKYGLRSISEMITRWAPPCENPTHNYIKRVSDYAGVSPDLPIFLGDKQVACKIVAAMAIVENSLPSGPYVPDMKEVEEGYDLAFPC